jgi:hypothetical protein
MSHETFYEQEQADDEADNTLKSGHDTVLVEGIGTMTRRQARTIWKNYPESGDKRLLGAYYSAANQ